MSDLGLHCQERETLNFKNDSPFSPVAYSFKTKQKTTKKQQQHEVRYIIYTPIGPPIIDFLRYFPILVGYYGTVFYPVGYSTVQYSTVQYSTVQTFSHSPQIQEFSGVQVNLTI